MMPWECRNAIPRATCIAILHRRRRSSGIVEACRSWSSEPRGTNSMTSAMSGGQGHAPRKSTIEGWRSWARISTSRWNSFASRASSLSCFGVNSSSAVETSESESVTRRPCAIIRFTATCAPCHFPICTAPKVPLVF